MPTLFTRIISGEIPSHKLLEDDRFFAFLDIRPVAPGHALVIPKNETDRFFDLEEDFLKEILPFSQRVARALEQTVPCNRVGIMVAGLEVPHAHLHLVPINGIGDLNFANATPGEPEELAALAEQIRNNL